MTSHCASPVSQVYIPESSGTRLWIRSCWNAPFFLRSYLRPALMAVLFLIQVTLALESEMVQARVTVSPSTATVSCGFSSISTVNMGNPKLDSIMIAFPFIFLYSLGIHKVEVIYINILMHAVTTICHHTFFSRLNKDISVTCNTLRSENYTYLINTNN